MQCEIWTNPGGGTSRGLHKERYCRIDVMSEL